MKLSWQIVRFDLKEIFSIAYGDYSYREALIVTLENNSKKGFGECTSIDYYQINLASFDTKLHEISSQVESHNIQHPTHFYTFLETLQLHPFLRSALDCAFWDLYGKLENKSFLELNSISTEKIPNSTITISIDTIENQIQKIEKSTWTKFKVKCNQFNLEDINQLLELNNQIALDSNGSFTKENCLELESFIGIEKFVYLEQPMNKGSENYKYLHSNTKANWMADEDCHTVLDLEKLQPHYASINIKLVKCGGLTPALQMIDTARKVNYKIMIGCMTESTIGISAGAVLAPLCDYADLDGANLIANDVAKGTKIENGKIYLNDKPGLGIELI